MKRIFSFVLSALSAVVFTTAHAQQNIFIWKGGNISVKSSANIDSITTSAGSWLFYIRTDAATSVNTTTLEATVRVSYADNVQSFSLTPEVGVCFSSDKATPTYSDERKRLGTSVRTRYDFMLSDLDPGTTYYYCAYVKLGDEVFYGNVESITTSGEKPSSHTYTLINGHKFVDLGLPSGLLWACTNIGAGSSSDIGDYFAWGETASKSYYGFETYKWSRPYKKYNDSDGKTTLDAEDDAATVNWGAPCRMPDVSEFEELVNNCVWTWTGAGYPVTGAGYLVTGPNGNTIFFPTTGRRLFNHVEWNWGGHYWSRSLYQFGSGEVDYLYFESNHNLVYVTYEDTRYYGYPVRPVAEK